MTPARLLLLALAAVAAAGVQGMPSDGQTLPNRTAADTEKAERQRRDAERLKRLEAIEQNGWTDYIAKTLEGIFSRTVTKAVGADQPTSSARSFLSCNSSDAADGGPPGGAAVPGKADGENATSGSGCEAPPPPMVIINSAELHDEVRESLRPANYSGAAGDGQILCLPGDTREICVIARKKLGVDSDNSPEISVSLRQNQTDIERVDRIHNVTSLRRNTTQQVEGGTKPRSSKIMERLDTNDQLRRDTNSSESDNSVGVRVSIDDQPDFVIGISHSTTDTDITANRTTDQQKLNNTETRSTNRTTKETETQDRRRESLDGASIRETVTTLNITFENLTRRRGTAGSEENDERSPIRKSTIGTVPIENNPAREEFAPSTVVIPGTEPTATPRDGDQDDGNTRDGEGTDGGESEPGPRRPEFESKLSPIAERVILNVPPRPSPAASQPDLPQTQGLLPAARPLLKRDQTPGRVARRPSARVPIRRLSSPVPVQSSLSRPDTDATTPKPRTVPGPEPVGTTARPRIGRKGTLSPTRRRLDRRQQQTHQENSLHWSGQQTVVQHTGKHTDFLKNMNMLRQSLIRSAFTAG